MRRVGAAARAAARTTTPARAHDLGNAVQLGPDRARSQHRFGVAT